MYGVCSELSLHYQKVIIGLIKFYIGIFFCNSTKTGDRLRRHGDLIMTKYTMVQFNKLFTQKMKEVKVLEKIHPKQSVALWVEIIELMIQFSKSPNCPRDLRKKLIHQADNFVVKVKLLKNGHIKSVFNEEMKSASSHNNTSKARVPQKSEEAMLETLQSVPETPSDIDMGESLPNIPDDNFSEVETSDENIPQEDAKSIDSQSIQNEAEISPTIDSNETKHISQIPENLEDNQEKLEPEDYSDSKPILSKEESFESLKQMPENLKEISPSPFDNKSILTPSKAKIDPMELDQFKQETTLLDVTKAVENLKNSPITSNQTHTQSQDQPPKDQPIEPFHPSNQSLDDFSNKENQLRSTLPFQIVGKTKDPFEKVSPSSQTSGDSLSSSPDPFATVNTSNLKENEEDTYSTLDSSNKAEIPPNCYACGTELKEGNSICPFCGTDNQF